MIYVEITTHKVYPEIFIIGEEGLKCFHEKKNRTFKFVIKKGKSLGTRLAIAVYRRDLFLDMHP